jgi:hypothetical protein
MPLIDLPADELQQAAQAARIGAVQAETDASNQSSPTVRANFEGSARRYRDLATKLEQARKFAERSR